MGLPSRPRALIVDDQRVVTTLLTAMLARLGFVDTIVAHDGEEALAALSANRVDVVLADITMERMSGLQLLAAIRRDEALRKTPVLLTTSARDPENVLAAKRLGATDFLLKPFSAETLRERLARLPSRAPA